MHGLIFLENYQILMEALKFMNKCNAIIKNGLVKQILLDLLILHKHEESG